MMAMSWARVLGVSLLAWSLGVALQLQQTALWPTLLYAFGLALSCAVAWALRQAALGHRLAMLAWGLLWAWSAFAVTGLHAQARSWAMSASLEGQELDVVGVVQAMPQRQDLGWRFRFRIEQAWRVDAAGVVQPVDLSRDLPALAYLGWYAQDAAHDSGWQLTALPEPVQAGERWRLRVRLKAPHGHMNPRGFDYELWLWEQGIHATGHVRTRAKDPPPVRLGRTWMHPIEGWRQTVRDRLLTHLAGPGTDADAAKRAGVLAALVLGDQAAIDRSD